MLFQMLNCVDKWYWLDHVESLFPLSNSSIGRWAGLWLFEQPTHWSEHLTTVSWFTGASIEGSTKAVPLKTWLLNNPLCEDVNRYRGLLRDGFLFGLLVSVSSISSKASPTWRGLPVNAEAYKNDVQRLSREELLQTFERSRRCCRSAQSNSKTSKKNKMMLITRYIDLDRSRTKRGEIEQLKEIGFWAFWQTSTSGHTDLGWSHATPAPAWWGTPSELSLVSGSMLFASWFNGNVLLFLMPGSENQKLDRFGL